MPFVSAIVPTVDIAAGAPKRVDGFMTASDEPGLGIRGIEPGRLTYL